MHSKRNINTNPNQESVIALTTEMIRIPSVTAIDENDLPHSYRAIEQVGEWAKRFGANATYMSFSGGHPKWSYAVPNVFIEWEFGKADKHLCYMGHVDVVPPGDNSKWTDNPFSGAIKDGYLYGRGVTDMKGSVAAFMTAITDNIEYLKAHANIRISMIITGDEEWAAVNGSIKVLEWMKNNNIRPDAFIVGEPSSQDHLGTHIKIGRRGSLCGTLQITGVQGHAAYQGLFQNPNRALALATTILNSHTFEDGNENFPNSNFEAIAISSGNFSASAVVPGKAEMLWNIRYTPQHTPDSLEKMINDMLAHPPAWAQSHPDAALLKNILVVANKDTASLPYCSTPGNLARAAQDAIKGILGIASQLDGTGGTTDGRFAARIFPDAEIIELGLPERGGIAGDTKPVDYLTKGGMHQVDERATLQDLVDLRNIFSQTVKNYDLSITKYKNEYGT